MVSGEIGYSASRPDNPKEMYQLARLVQGMHNIPVIVISKFLKLRVFWKRG
jgi:hypothetical protein